MNIEKSHDRDKINAENENRRRKTESKSIKLFHSAIIMTLTRKFTHLMMFILNLFSLLVGFEGGEFDLETRSQSWRNSEKAWKYPKLRFHLIFWIVGEFIRKMEATNKLKSKLSSISLDKSRISNRSRSTVRFSLTSSIESPEISQIFNAISIRGNRRTTIVRPVVQFHPTYRLESKNPFDSYEVELIIKRIVELKMEFHEKISFATDQVNKLAEELSIEILTQVKMKSYDRFRIIVFVDVGEKYHQSFKCGLRALWDNEKDAFAKYIYERQDLFIVTTVFGVYYDWRLKIRKISRKFKIYSYLPCWVTKKYQWTSTYS